LEEKLDFLKKEMNGFNTIKKDVKHKKKSGKKLSSKA
jgi:hypothetical protein